MTGWAASTSTAPGTLRRQSAGQAVFTASQSTTTMTVTAVTSGTIYIGMTFATSGNLNTVTALGTGTGGTGTYTMSLSATVASTTWTGGFNQNNGRAFIAVQTTTQNTGTTEPSWVFTKGAKTTDGSVTWMECTGQAATNGDVTNTQNWTAVKNTAVALGRIITDNAGTHFFIVTTAGTVGNGSEPTWTTTSAGNTTADNTVTWTYIGTSFSAWAAPFTHLGFVFGTNWAAAGDTVYVGDDHSENMGGSNGISITPPGTGASPNFIYSIDHTLSLPVSSSGLKTGATVSSNASTVIVVNSSSAGCHAYYYGFTLNAGTGATNATLQINNSSSASYTKLEACALKVLCTGSSGGVIFNNTSAASQRLELINTTMQFGATGQIIKTNMNGKVIWRNTASAIAGATFPTTLFFTTSAGVVVLEGVDLSAIAGTLVPAGTSGSSYAAYQFIDCKLNASVTIAATPVNPGGPFVDVIRCSSAASTYIQRRYLYEGTLQEEATIIKTGGASDGTTPISWKITTTANSKWIMPFESFAVSLWNGVTGTNRVVTLSGIWNAAALPNNDDVWIEVCYLGASGSPLGSWKSSGKADNLATGSPLSADANSAWDSVATARQNSHAYSLGDVIKLASNPSRLFWCTTAGTTAGSEPGGYASAVDGGSVTDNTAVFRAGMRFLLSTTLNSPQPQLAGHMRVYIKAAKVSSTFYVDPVVTLS